MVSNLNTSLLNQRKGEMKMKKHLHKLTMLMFSQKAYDRARSVYRVALLGTTIACCAIVPAFAADPLSAINSLSDFVFSDRKSVV